MKEAVNMMGIPSEVNPLHRPASHSGYRGFNESKKESSDSIDMRKNMGITDEDKKKYGGDNWIPKYQ